MKRRTASETEAFSGDYTTRLATLRQSTETWISSTDSKAMTLLGAGGATLAIAGIQTTQRSAESITFFASIFFVLFCCLGVMSCISSVCCLWPRTERKRLLRDRNVQPLPKSPSVFWELADLDTESFTTYAAYAPEDTLQRDALEQAIMTTWVAKQKLTFLKLALILYMGALFALFLSLLLSMLYV